MTEKSNIQYFDEITAKVFAQLYESFPIPLDLDCIELTKSPDIDDDGKITREAKICIESLKWLQEEDFIKYKTAGRFDAYEIKLTAKGLTALKSTPETLQAKKTIGEKLLVAVNSGSVSAGAEVLKLLFSVIK